MKSANEFIFSLSPCLFCFVHFICLVWALLHNNKSRKQLFRARCIVFITEENPKKFCVHYKITTDRYFAILFQWIVYKAFMHCILRHLKISRCIGRAKYSLNAADRIKILCCLRAKPSSPRCTLLFALVCAYRLNKRHNMVSNRKSDAQTQIFSQ